MKSFFSEEERRQLRAKGGQSRIPADELMEMLHKEGYLGATVQPKLSIHPEWKLPEEDQYAFRFLNKEAPPLEANQIALFGVQKDQVSEKQVNYIALIRHSVNDTVSLKTVNVVLRDQHGAMMAKKSFDLSKAGKLPAKTSRPWIFTFDVKDIKGKGVFPDEGWTLEIQQKKKTYPYLIDTEDLEDWMPEEKLEALRMAIQERPKPVKGTVSMQNFEMNHNQKDQEMAVTLLIQNGNHHQLSLSKLPLAVYDHDKDKVAEAQFTFDPPIQLKPNSTKPWSFHFSSETMIKQRPDFRTWYTGKPE